MRRRIISHSFAFAVMFATTCGIAQAKVNSVPSTKDIKVIVNGDQIEFDGVGPRQISGRVMVPLRGVLERLGAYVDWDSGSQTVIATKDQTKIRLSIGKSYATVNGERIRLDVAAETIEGTTMVPLRFLSESLGAEVLWNDQTSTVRISTKDGANSDTTDAERIERNRQRAQRRAEEARNRPQGNRLPEIESVVTDFSGGRIRGGDRIHVTMRATAGGRGFFRIRGVVGEQKMDETSPGVYELTWRAADDKEFRVNRADFLAFVIVGDKAAAEKSPNSNR